MGTTVNQYILDKQAIAYLITDSQLIVQTWYGDISLAHLEPSMLEQTMLSDMIPELMGLEDAVLSKILDGTLEHYQLDFVTRTNAEGDITYINMVVLPHQSANSQIEGVILVMTDATRLGSMLQELTQQRNELRLLREKHNQQTIQLQEKKELQDKLRHILEVEFEKRLLATSFTLETLLMGKQLDDTQRTALEHVDETIHRLTEVAQQLSKILAVH